MFVDDPFPKDSYLLLFTTRLYYRDMTIDVQRTVAQPAPPDYSGYDAVFGFQGGRLTLLASSAGSRTHL